MKGEQLRDAILALIEAHPKFAVSAKGHAAHAKRFITDDGVPFAIEPERKTFQNLWVRADSVNRRRLRGIDSRYYDHTKFDHSTPNHNLFGEPTFTDTDLICFKVDDVWQAVRVIAEVAGLGTR